MTTERPVEFIKIGSRLYSAEKIIYISPLESGQVTIKLDDGVRVIESVAFTDVAATLAGTRSPQA